MTEKKLKDKVVFITGASRGIGREIALRCAQDGAKVVVAAKSADAHPTLPGTIYTVAKEIEAAGGEALPIQLDVRDEVMVYKVVEKAIEAFGGIDILINNVPMKRFDLMFAVNVRGTFVCSQACIPHLKNSTNPHILNLSPPLNMKAKWFKNHLAYTMSKYGMSMCTLGMAEEFKKAGIAVNSLWPETTIATAAIEVNFPKEIYEASRKPAIVADAAYGIITSPSRETTGNFFIDEDYLRTQGVSDFAHYSINPAKKPFKDAYLD
jgi:citronellol/citronellal dehydrogenase